MNKLESFKSKEKALTKALEASMLLLIEDNPAGFCEWLGMTYISPIEDPCDEWYLKDISTRT